MSVDKIALIDAILDKRAMWGICLRCGEWQSHHLRWCKRCGGEFDVRERSIIEALIATHAAPLYNPNENWQAQPKYFGGNIIRWELDMLGITVNEFAERAEYRMKIP